MQLWPPPSRSPKITMKKSFFFWFSEWIRKSKKNFSSASFDFVVTIAVFPYEGRKPPSLLIGLMLFHLKTYIWTFENNRHQRVFSKARNLLLQRHLELFYVYFYVTIINHLNIWTFCLLKIKGWLKKRRIFSIFGSW